MDFVFLGFIILLIILAVREKMRTRVRASSTGGLPEEIKASPLSQALTELVAIAGGIYLSLLMLTTFLAMELPKNINLLVVEVDTIAGIALFLTIVQPFILKLKRRVMGKWN